MLLVVGRLAKSRIPSYSDKVKGTLRGRLWPLQVRRSGAEGPSAALSELVRDTVQPVDARWTGSKAVPRSACFDDRTLGLVWGSRCCGMEYLGRGDVTLQQED